MNGALDKQQKLREEILSFGSRNLTAQVKLCKYKC